MKKKDLELLDIYTGEPRSNEGIGAETLLRYRQYLALKSYNKLIIILTIVLAVSAAVEAWSVRQATIATRAQQSSTNSAGLMQAREISNELEKIRETLERAQSNHSNSNQKVENEQTAPR